MYRPKLSIYVPTWNRANHFNNLIDSLNGQITDDVEVVASFNPPNDNYRWPSWCRVVRQQSNVGGRVNFLLGPLLTRGDYLWMIGDDDEVLPGGVAAVLEACEKKPGIIVNWDGVLNLGCDPGSWFPTYKDFCEAVYPERATIITALTLCSATVCQRATFDIELGLLKTDTMYGQHYAALSNVLDEPVSVVGAATFRAAVAAETASIFLQPPNVIDEHMRMYPRVMYDLVDWLNVRCGMSLRPELCWVPGQGFDG